MAAAVWWWNLRAARRSPYAVRMKRLLKATNVGGVIDPGDLVAVKLHFGEHGTTAHIQPLELIPVIDFVRKAGGAPFLTDTNTLYVGQRGESVSHALQAARHGFDPNLLGAPVIIADGLKSGNERAVPMDGRHIKTAYLAGDIVDADLLVTVSHFKGHELAGFGGALKNLAMGCATRRGKMHQHGGLGPEVHPEHCTGCGACVAVCAAGALALDATSHRITLNRGACVGCAACFLVCRHRALVVDWRTDISAFLERMAEYAAAVLRSRPRPTLHLSFVRAVTPGCDCLGYSDAPICPDIGVFASWDPVALDQTCLDRVNAAPPLYPSALPEGLAPGEDKFHALHPGVRGEHLLAYAEGLGLGSRDYVLREIAS